jgi:hypothetical protein
MDVTNLQNVMMNSSQDHHCHERTICTLAEKHALTPESKAAAESKPRRFAGLLIYVRDSIVYLSLFFETNRHIDHFQKFIIKFISKFVNKTSDWLQEN